MVSEANADLGNLDSDVLDRLMQEIHVRAKTLPEGSYTTKLIEGGVAKMGEKITEEAAEVVEAAELLIAASAEGTKAETPVAEPPVAESAMPELATTEPAAGDIAEGGTHSSEKSHLIYEACDLIYHLWVLLGSQNISVDDLRSELQRREGVSGLKEKASRPQKTER